jgi:hypothetical protein
MPMNPRLLRPTQGGFSSPDADARAYLAAVRVADGSNLEPAVAKAISDFVIGCKTDGIWDAIKASCILAGARTLSGALTPLKGGSPTNVNNNFVSGDYNRKTGLLGDGVGKSLNTNRNNNADPQDSNHHAAYVSAAAVGFIIAAESSNDAGSNRIFVGGSTTTFRNRYTSVQGSVASPSLTGFLGMSRSASASFVYRQAGTNTTVSDSSSSPFNSNVMVFARNAGSPNNFSAGRFAFYSVGESLDLALLDTRVTNLYNAIGAAI